MHIRDRRREELRIGPASAPWSLGERPLGVVELELGSLSDESGVQQGWGDRPASREARRSVGSESLTGAETNETRQRSAHFKSNRVDQRSFGPGRGQKQVGEQKA